MTSAKITLEAATQIPLNQLEPSSKNVRRIKAGVSIPELADDIAHRGLLQSLSVRPVQDADGKETGTFRVQGGGRRYRALQLLVQHKRLAKNAPVPCIVRRAGLEREDSLAENVMREALHPLDQFNAFRELMDEEGLCEAEIAARFVVSPIVVRQRMKLLTVSPKLLEVYAEDGMTLAQLEAFSVSADHAHQETVWEAIKNSWSQEPRDIRAQLTAGAPRADRDKRAVFVGVEAYEAAGGTVLRDLFTEDGGGYLADTALLDRLAVEKMQAIVAEVQAEGWRWVEASLQGFPYNHTYHMRQIEPVAMLLGEEEQARYDAEREEYDRLHLEYEGLDELPEEVDARLSELERLIEATEAATLRYEPEQVAYAGAFISLDHQGVLKIDRGWVRRGDEPKVEGEPGQEAGTPGAGGYVQRATLTIGGADVAAGAGEAEEDDAERPLSAALLADLTTQRTAALREAVAADPGAAFVAVLYTLALQAFYGTNGYTGGTYRARSAESCLEVGYRSASFGSSVPGLAEMAAVTALETRRRTWAALLPEDAGALWAYLVGLDAEARGDLFALCAAMTVNAINGPQPNAYGMDRSRPIAHADQLAELVGLDMSTQWEPTVDNFLGRVTKGRIQAAVREAKGEHSAQLLDHLKRHAMAVEAERLLAGTGWLPQPLRTRGMSRGEPADLPVPAAPDRAEPGEGEALPAFLSEDGEEGDTLEHDQDGIEPYVDEFDGPMPADLDGFDPDYHAIAAE